MKIIQLKCENYRTLESFEVRFKGFYTAICGKNDSGKTNVVRAIRCLLKEPTPFPLYAEEGFSLADDFTKWNATERADRRLSVAVTLRIDPSADSGLHKFLTDYLDLETNSNRIEVDVRRQIGAASADYRLELVVAGKSIKGQKAEETLRRIQTGQAILLHESTAPHLPAFTQQPRGLLRELSQEYAEKLANVQKRATNLLKRIAREQQQEFGELLGRLQEKYEVGLSLPSLDLSRLPFDLTLTDRKIDVHLDDWGGGTRNRTLILLTLFRARQFSKTTTPAAKSTPVIVIEEPESFLHPSAQAEFGRVLQDLADEFEVQIIATTHSPYMLNQRNAESNILLERRRFRRKLLETQRIDTSGDNWMKPFGLALGLDSSEFEPWRSLFFGSSDSILLVEGETDKEYFELLRQEAHGDKRLLLTGDIFPYGGWGTLKNTQLLSFIRDKYRKMFITFDLDSQDNVERGLTSLGLKKRKDYLAIGLDKPGCRNIEGLLPEDVRARVRNAKPELVDALTGSKDERKHAARELKKLMLEEFRTSAQPRTASYEEFYEVTKLINKSLPKEVA